MTSTIESIQSQLVDEFSAIDNWDDRYKRIIDLGKQLPELDDTLKTDDNIVRGCQSQVWMTADYQDGKITLQADSDALIVKGLIALILRVYHNQSPADILENPPVFLEQMELGKHISMTRSNGLHAMIKQIQFYAMAYQMKAQQAGA